nr:hypothetical protein CFP56_06303 [Quercus suber]
MKLEIGESFELEDQLRFGMKLKVGESLELEDQVGPLHKQSTMELVTERAMEPVTDSSEAILKSNPVAHWKEARVGATIATSNDLAMALKLFTTVNLRLVHDSINAASIVFDRIMNIHYGDWIKEVLRNQK